MPHFSRLSLDRLSTCHTDLQTLFNETIKYFDCAVIYGFRSEGEQHKAFVEGKTQKQWPNSLHNKIPSLAADVAPYDREVKIDWNDIRRFYYFAGWVKCMAVKLKEEGRITHDIRWGGDWDNDTKTKDNGFNDLVHFELIPSQ